jgi:S1-C subfamily serine protease
LKQLKLIVDGNGGFAYVKPNDSPLPAYQHNRLGAVFVPSTDDADPLIAQVAKPSPANEAGIRNGDVLLKINDLEVTNWRSDPKVLPLSRFFAGPAGTELKLSLKRDGKTFVATARLREILAPKAAQQKETANRKN